MITKGTGDGSGFQATLIKAGFDRRPTRTRTEGKAVSARNLQGEIAPELGEKDHPRVTSPMPGLFWQPRQWRTAEYQGTK
jgi:hypothetical protein